MADTVKARPLRPYEKKRLQRMKRQRTNAVNYGHARVVLLSRGGWRTRDIAEAVGCSPQWVRVILHRFNADGVCGISWYPFFQTRDTPRQFDRDIRDRIAEIAMSPPTALIGMQQWSLSKLRDYLVEQKIVPSISVEWLRQLLRRREIRLRRTKTWKESTDPQFWPKYQALGVYTKIAPRMAGVCASTSSGRFTCSPGMATAMLAGANCTSSVSRRITTGTKEYATSWRSMTWRPTVSTANSPHERPPSNGWRSSNGCGGATLRGRNCTSSWTTTRPISRSTSSRGPGRITSNST